MGTGHHHDKKQEPYRHKPFHARKISQNPSNSIKIFPPFQRGCRKATEDFCILTMRFAYLYILFPDEFHFVGYLYCQIMVYYYLCGRKNLQLFRPKLTKK